MNDNFFTENIKSPENVRACYNLARLNSLMTPRHFYGFQKIYGPRKTFRITSPLSFKSKCNYFWPSFLSLKLLDYRVIPKASIYTF